MEGEQDELERLLGPDVEEKKEETKEEEKTEEGDKKVEKTAAEVALLNEVKKLREKDRAKDDVIAELTTTLKPLLTAMKPAESSADKPIKDNTQDEWLSHIDKTASAKGAEAAKPAMEEIGKLKEAYKAKALKAFIKEHPDYAPTSESGKDKLRGLLEKAKALQPIMNRSEIDEEEVGETFKDAWAILERSSIESQAEEVRTMMMSAESSVADQASTSGGSQERTSNIETKATPAMVRAAKELGVPLDYYVKNRSRIPWGNA